LSTFVIAHGAWTGAWSWRRVIDRLAARGHRVHAPTLSGLCERSHLAGVATITLSTHISDTVAALSKDPTWTVREIECGHDVPIDRPEELTDLLEAAA
jgi:hypothetical protein